MSELQPLQYRAKSSALYYLPPRPFSAPRLLLATLGATVVGVMLALLYVWALDQTMSLYVRLMLCVGVGIGLGVASHLSTKWGRVYSAGIATLIACAVGLVALYVGWAFWLHRYLEVLYAHVTTWRLIVHPIGMFRVMRLINRQGTLVFEGDTLQGFPLRHLSSTSTSRSCFTRTLRCHITSSQ